MSYCLRWGVPQEWREFSSQGESGYWSVRPRFPRLGVAAVLHLAPQNAVRVLAVLRARRWTSCGSPPVLLDDAGQAWVDEAGGCKS